jgi:hypothetical protein
MLLSKREQHMHMIEQFSQQDVATPPRTPDTATVSRSSSFSSLSALSAPPSIMNRSTSFHGISSSSADASALSLFSQRGGASCLVQQLSLSRTMAAGTQQDFVSQIAMGLKSDSSEDRDNACSALVNICSKGEYFTVHFFYCSTSTRPFSHKPFQTACLNSSST